jgi:hypothetical protein
MFDAFFEMWRMVRDRLGPDQCDKGWRSCMDLSKYRSLFVHRDDVFAQQQKDGAYLPVRRALTNEDIEEHLAGLWSIGAYVIDPEGRLDADATTLNPNTVSYIVFDLDTYSPEAYEWLVECLEELARSVDEVSPLHPLTQFPYLLMENSGGKGFHAWLFLSEPLPAARVRAWVARDFLPIWNERADGFDGTPLEIFPKQDAVPEGGFGNLIKLPLGVHAKSGKRSAFITHQGWANSVDTVERLDVSLIPEVPASKAARRSDGSLHRSDGSRHAPFACIAKLVDEGAPSGCRDKAMLHLAHYCWGTGVMDYEQVLDTCERVNEEFSPPLPLHVVGQKVQSAQRLEAAHPSCKADWLGDFCPGGENCYRPGNDRGNSSAEVDNPVAYMSLTPEERRLARLGRVGSG